MTSLYDKILHSKLTGPGAKYLFVGGLKLRALFFAIRNVIGRIFYRRLRTALDLTKISKIALVRTDRIGDIILSTPALKALRARYPKARIDYIVQNKYTALLNCFHGWSNVIGVDISDKKQLRGIGDTLRKTHYDVVIVQHPAKYAYGLAKSANAPCVIGWNAKGFGYLLTNGFKDDRGAADRHQVENNLRLLTPLGIFDSEPSFPIKETPDGQKQFETFCERHGIKSGERIFAVHPGSYSPRVRWAPEKFGELVDKARAEGLSPVILATASDSAVVAEALKSVSSNPIVARDEMDFEGLVSFFKHVTVFVGNSTGPTHLAASAGAWTIAIFGNRYPMDRWELWKPWGPKGIVVTSKKFQCANCTPWTCAHMECLSSISVEDVWREIAKIVTSK